MVLARATASAATDAFAIHYEGEYVWHQDWEGGSSGPTAGAFLRTNETLSWVMDATGSKAGPGGAGDLHVRLRATGTIDQQGSDPNAERALHDDPGGCWRDERCDDRWQR